MPPKNQNNKSTRIITELKKLVDEISKAKTINDIHILSHNISSKFLDIVRVTAEKEIEEAYAAAHKEVHGVSSPSFSTIDHAAIHAIKTDKTLHAAYMGISDELSAVINENITAYYRNQKNITDFINDLKEQVNLSEKKLLEIFRSETSATSNIARSHSYRRLDPGGEKKYYWRVIHDSHTSDECEEVEAHVNNHGGSVSLVELENIIRMITIKYRGPSWKIKPFQSHLNCRSQIGLKI